MVKILIIAGTRPEAIKLAPVIHQIKKHPAHFDLCVCSTGQHNEMLRQAWQDFNITSDVDLQVMTEGQSLSSLSSRLLSEIDPLLLSVRPDWVLVQGDTTTVMMTALCAFYHGLKVGHVEAGLRSFSNREPFPEEANRRVASVLADLHFAPTSRARDNLIKEGVPAEKIVLTGNTVVDALTWMVKKVRSEPPLLPARVEEIIASGKKIILVTGHRRESFGDGFRNICEAMRQLSQTNPDIAFVYPVHMNPNVQEPVFRLLGDCPGIHLIEPLPYKAFVRLMDCSSLILTDSGGIQEEGPSLGKPVLVMRNLTERPEGIEAGCAKLVGTDPERIVAEVNLMLSKISSSSNSNLFTNPYGDGNAANKIVDVLARY